MKTVAIILLSLVSILPYAANAKPIAICGPFTISSSDDGFAHINNVRPQSQKFTFLKSEGDYTNVKYQWMIPDAQTGRWLGLDYVKRNGQAILNVEGIRMNMGEPRVFGTYDCEKVK